MNQLPPLLLTVLIDKLNKRRIFLYSISEEELSMFHFFALKKVSSKLRLLMVTLHSVVRTLMLRFRNSLLESSSHKAVALTSTLTRVLSSVSVKLLRRRRLNFPQLLRPQSQSHIYPSIRAAQST